MSSLLDIPYQVVISAEDSQIAFDATVSERHRHELKVTEHPVEEGASVSDHAQLEPDVLDIQGIISNTPILLNVEDNIQPSIPGGNPDNRAQDAYNEFLRLQQTAALLEVATEIRDYSDMMITSISVPREKGSRHILDIGLTLQAFRKATVESVAAPQPIEPVHRSKAKNGRQNLKTPQKQVEQKTESALEAFANWTDRRRGGAQ